MMAKKPEAIILVKLTSADEADNASAAEIVKQKFGKVDVIIANAGRLPIAHESRLTFQHLIQVFNLSPVSLLQPFEPRLKSTLSAHWSSSKLSHLF